MTQGLRNGLWQINNSYCQLQVYLIIIVLLFWNPSNYIQQYETFRELVPLECIYPGDSNWMHMAQRRMIFGVVDVGGHTTVRVE